MVGSGNEFGVASPLVSYCYITVNGEDWGLYLAVEAVEDSFLERKEVFLPKGRHILTLDALSSGINMDYIEFKRVEK